MWCELAAAEGESAAEGDVEGLQGGLPPHGPAFAALACGVQAYDGHIDALQRGGLVREMPGAEVSQLSDYPVQPVTSENDPDSSQCCCPACP